LNTRSMFQERQTLVGRPADLNASFGSIPSADGEG
jgi:hypothetical protein